jgi:4-amino-4-deoxy-L-arabinose transferase-like glycosyltransferase
MSRRTVVLLIMILLVALSFRLFLVARSAGAPLFADEVTYDSIAMNLIEGHGYSRGTGPDFPPTAVVGPGYVLMLAAVYAVVGHQPVGVKLVQVVLDCLSCLLLFRISIRLFHRTDTALLASLIYALYPPFAMHTNAILTETLAVFVTILAISLFLDHATRRTTLALYLSAFVSGVAALSRPILAMLPGLFFLSAFRGAEKRLPLLKHLVLQCAVVGLVMSPWVLRNAVVFHSFIPSVTLGGVTFWGGTGPADGRVVGGLGEPWTPKHVEPAVRGLSEVERDRWFFREGMRVIREHPARFLRVALRKVPRLWFNLAKDERSNMATKALGAVGLGSGVLSRVSLVFALGNLIAMILAVVGIVRLKPPKVSVDLLMWLVLYFTLTHMMFFAVFRYSLPVYAYLFCFTAAGVTSLYGTHPAAQARRAS